MMTQRSRGRQPPRRLGRRVVGGQAGVGERGDIRRFQRVVDLHDAAGRCLEVLGVPAVGVDAGKRVGLAVHIVAGAAGPAQPARDQRVDDDLVAFADVGDRRADGVNPAGVLVPDRVRQLDLDFSAHWPSRMCRSVRHTPAPPILTTTSNGPVGVGDGYLGHLEVLVVADNLDGAHGAHRSAPLGDVSADSGMKVGSYEASAASAPSDRWTWSRCEPG